jgi:chromosome segregation ATPase
VHCLVLRGLSGVVARAWAPQSYLNGVPLTTAPLHDGDILRLGPVELEYIDEARREAAALEAQATSRTSADRALIEEVTRRVQAKLTRRDRRAWKKAARRSIRVARSKIRILKRKLRQAVQQAAASARETSRIALELEQWQQRSSTVPQPDVIAELATLQQALEQARQEQQEQQLLTDLARQDFERALAARTQELHHLQATLRDAERCYFESEQLAQENVVASRAAQEECARLSAQLRDQENALQQKEAILSSRELEYNSLRTEWTTAQTEATQFREALAAREQELATAQGAEAALRAEIVQLTATLQAWQTEHAELPPLTQALQEARAETLRSQAIVSEQAREVAALRDELESARAAWQQQETKLAAEMSRAAELSQSLSATEAVASERGRDLAALAKQHEEVQAQLARMEATTSQLTALAQADAAQWKLQYETLLATQGVDEQSQADASAHQARIAELEQQLNQSEAELLAAQQELTLAQQQLGQREEELRTLQHETTSRMTTLEALVAQLEAQLQTLANQGTERQEAADQQLALQRQEEQAAWSRQLTTLQNQLAQCEAEQQELLDRVAQLTQRLADSDEAVLERDRMLAGIRDEVAQQFELWTAERNEFVAQLDQLRAERDVAAQAPVSQAEVANDLAEDNNLSRAREVVEEVHARSDSETFSAVMAKLEAVGLLQDDPSTSRESHLPETPPQEQGELVAEPLATQASPAAQDDIFATLKAKLLAEADDADEPTAMASAGHAPAHHPNASALPEHASTHHAHGHAAGDGGQDAIEEYMARLLKRVRGESAVCSVTATPSPAPPAPEVLVENLQSAQQIVVPLLDEEEYVPRGAAPEKQVDINALRDIAMTSARQAIDLSAVRSHRQQAILIMFGVLCGTVAGSVLLVYAFKTGTMWAAYTAFPCFGLGLYGMMQRLKLLKRTWAR